MRRRWDLEALREAQRREVEGRRPWARLRAFLKRWTGRVKDVTAFLTAAGALLAAGKGLWHYMKDREVPPPQLPATGQPTTATDYVDKPKEP